MQQKEAPDFTQTETRNQIVGSVRGHAPEETDRANAASSQMDSGLLETDPKRTGEEPGGAPDATLSGIQREWAVSNILTGNAQGPTSQYTRKDAREK